jgi:Zn-dependent protease
VSFFRQLNFEYLIRILLSVIPALLCITVHECSHGLAAYALGDDTAKRQGRVTLNPIRHIDPFGLIMLAVAGFGWAKPVQVDSRRFRNPKLGMALTALAGPVSNLLFAAICYAITRYTDWPLWVTLRWRYGGLMPVALGMLTRMNLGLALFNLIPFPPLDGSKVLFAFLPDKYYYRIMKYERYGMLVLIALMLALRFFGGS